MKVGIMQPYFMPYIGYFSLIKHTDLFILFDPVQFIRHGWIERNRVLKQDEGCLYIQVPLIKNNSRETLIKDCLIDNTQVWQSKILSQIQHYKKKAPYYFKVLHLLNEIFEKKYDDIVSLNKASLEIICNYIGFEKVLPVFSKMDLNIEMPNEADEWALNICTALKGNDTIHYINPIGGQVFFDAEKYKKKGIELSFQNMSVTAYDQKRDTFEAGLSIIDVLMFNSPEEVNKMLDQYQLI